MEREHGFGKKSGFVSGVAVGFGVGCLSTFIALLITIFYYSSITSQNFSSTLSSLSFPITYFFILGVLFLTLGLLWERLEKQLK